jgi:4-amino-4-deoxy-L-arabinose transferase-like glycosyltransferase
MLGYAFMIVRISTSARQLSLRELGRPLVLVTLLALSLRILYFSSYVHLPFLYGPVCDSLVYLEQARAIAAGHLGDPTLLAYSPLYGVWLALVGGTKSLLIPVLLQLVLGVVIVAGLFILGARVTGSVPAGLVAALVYSAYPAPLFYETKILSETLGLGFVLATLALLFPGSSRLPALRFAAAGICLGLAILARASLVFIGPILVLFAVLPWTAEDFRFRPRAIRACSIALGLCAVLAIHGGINWVATGRFVPIILMSTTIEHTAALPVGQDIHGTSQTLGSGRASPNDVLVQAQKVLNHADATSASIARVDWRGYLRAAPEKIAATFSPSERLYQYGVLGERSEILVLRALPASFGTLSLLGFLGLIVLLGAGKGYEALRLLPFILGILATTTLYHPTTRYRLAMALPLCLLAGLAVPEWSKLRMTLRRGVLAIAGIGTLLLAIQGWRAELRYPALWETHKAESAIQAADRPGSMEFLAQARLLAADDAQRAEVDRVHELCALRFGSCD